MQIAAGILIIFVGVLAGGLIWTISLENADEKFGLVNVLALIATPWVVGGAIAFSLAALGLT